MKAWIELSGMRFYAYHGCLESEKRLGNDFIVDFRCPCDIGKAGRSDCLVDTLNYSAVYAVVAREMRNPSNLLENVACRIADALAEEFPGLQHFDLTVSKKNPPVGGECEWARVSISR